jgi:hypothetical protein
MAKNAMRCQMEKTTNQHARIPHIGKGKAGTPYCEYVHPD